LKTETEQSTKVVDDEVKAENKKLLRILADKVDIDEVKRVLSDFE